MAMSEFLALENYCSKVVGSLASPHDTEVIVHTLSYLYQSSMYNDGATLVAAMKLTVECLLM